MLFGTLACAVEYFLSLCCVTRHTDVHISDVCSDFGGRYKAHTKVSGWSKVMYWFNENLPQSSSFIGMSYRSNRIFYWRSATLWSAWTLAIVHFSITFNDNFCSIIDEQLTRHVQFTLRTFTQKDIPSAFYLPLLIRCVTNTDIRNFNECIWSNSKSTMPYTSELQRKVGKPMLDLIPFI